MFVTVVTCSRLFRFTQPFKASQNVAESLGLSKKGIRPTASGKSFDAFKDLKTL